MRFKRILCFALCLITALYSVLPITAYAQEEERKVVRVGSHDAPYFITDGYGRKSGYSYEYQRKLTAYTGWDYEYVDGTWSELFEMLKNGEIDLMSNISYTDERARDVLYASLPMGTEAYYIYIPAENTEITSEDYSSLNGKTVGVTKGTIQKDLFLKWEEAHGIKSNLVEINAPDEESLRLLGGELDAFITMDVYGNAGSAVPLCKLGSSDFYFAVSKDRPDLQVELDAAMNRIQDENKYFNQQLHEEYLSNSNTDRYLSDKEKEWLLEHGTIRVGYQDNYLAFCAKDPKTGELTGALKDYLAYAATSLENAGDERRRGGLCVPCQSDGVRLRVSGCGHVAYAHAHRDGCGGPRRGTEGVRPETECCRGRQ